MEKVKKGRLVFFAFASARPLLAMVASSPFIAAVDTQFPMLTSWLLGSISARKQGTCKDDVIRANISRNFHPPP
jgi:hypothetical protein